MSVSRKGEMIGREERERKPRIKEITDNLEGNGTNKKEDRIREWKRNRRGRGEKKQK